MKINRIAIILLLFFFGASQSMAQPKNVKIYWGIDAFPVDIAPHVCFRFNDKFSIGAQLDSGVNLSNYFIKTTGAKSALGFDSESYWGVFSFSLFTRLFIEKKVPVDLGIRQEAFLHFNDGSEDGFKSGVFDAFYVKAFIPTKMKEKDYKKKQSVSIGLEFAIGNLKEGLDKELGIAISVWTRFYLNYR